MRAASRFKPRGKIVRVESRYRYEYNDLDRADSQASFLRSQGLQGAGHSWEGIVYGLLQLRSPEILGQIEFDDSDNGVAIWCHQMSPLEVVADLVGEVTNDRALMVQAIEVAKRDQRME